MYINTKVEFPETPSRVIESAVAQFKRLHDDADTDQLRLDNTVHTDVAWHVTLSYPRKGWLFIRDKEEFVVAD